MKILSILNLASLPLTTPLLFQIFRIPAVQSGRDGQVLVQPSGPSDAKASGRACRKRRSRLRVAGPGFQKERKLHQKRVFELVRKHFLPKYRQKDTYFYWVVLHHVGTIYLIPETLCHQFLSVIRRQSKQSKFVEAFKSRADFLLIKSSRNTPSNPSQENSWGLFSSQVVLAQYSTLKSSYMKGAAWLAYLLPDPAPPSLIHSIPPKILGQN